jgi:hypothetical protein
LTAAGGPLGLVTATESTKIRIFCKWNREPKQPSSIANAWEMQTFAALQQSLVTLCRDKRPSQKTGIFHHAL